MRVFEIRWLDENKYDAEVRVGSLNGEDGWAFCSPCSVSDGQELQRPLLTLDSKIFAATEKKPKIQRQLAVGYWAYFFAGKLVKQRVVKINKVEIEIVGELPGDLKEGDWIEGVCERLDIVG